MAVIGAAWLKECACLPGQLHGRVSGLQGACAAHLAEVHEGGGAALLLLLPVDVLDRDVDVVEQLRVVLHRIAGGEEHHHLHPSTHRLTPANHPQELCT